MNFKKFHDWPTVAVIGILTVLVLAGHNGRIELGLLAALSSFLGVSVFLTSRKDK